MLAVEMHAHAMGSSATAKSFGARVSLATEGRSLYFAVGRDGPPDAAIHAAGGTIVARLSDPRHALALAPLEAHSVLRGHPRLEHVGPVSIDPERFERFARLIGLDGNGA